MLYFRSLWASLLILGTPSLVSPIAQKALRGKLKILGKLRIHDTLPPGPFWEVQGEDLGGGNKVLTRLVDPKGSADFPDCNLEKANQEN